MRQKLPPLNALRIFEVAARAGSYSAAARELNLTHGAVSRQIAILEDWLAERRVRSHCGRRGTLRKEPPRKDHSRQRIGHGRDALADPPAAFIRR